MFALRKRARKAARACGLIVVVVFALALGGCSKTTEPPPPTAPATAVFTSAAPDQIASSQVSEGGRCSVDSIDRETNNEGWTIHKGASILISGWILDMDTRTTSDWAVIRLDTPEGGTHYYVSTRWRGERADLNDALGKGPGLSKVTFTVTTTTDVLPTGSYNIVVLHQPSTGVQACNTGKALMVLQ